METLVLVVALVASVAVFFHVMRPGEVSIRQRFEGVTILDGAQLVRNLPKDPRPPRVLPAVMLTDSWKNVEIDRLTRELRQSNERLNVLTAQNAERVCEVAARF